MEIVYTGNLVYLNITINSDGCFVKVNHSTAITEINI